MKNQVFTKITLTAGVIAVYAVLAGGSGPETSQATCKVSNLTSEPDVQLINGAMDAGYLIKFRVMNTGQAGSIRVAPWLSSSEGEWSREQNLVFEPQQSFDLKYFFYEPTINATNIQYGVKCTP